LLLLGLDLLAVSMFGISRSAIVPLYRHPASFDSPPDCRLLTMVSNIIYQRSSIRVKLLLRVHDIKSCGNRQLAEPG
jgi:hypothetical protein